MLFYGICFNVLPVTVIGIYNVSVPGNYDKYWLLPQTVRDIMITTTLVLDR